MAQWSDGYTSDIEYTYGCYPEMSPAALHWALICAGVKPTFDPTQATYCELGFGQGMSLLTAAAANPNAQFWGTDFMPSQVAGALDLARAGALDNVHLFDDSFNDFARRDLPKFDIIALHGVLSWISPANQQVLVDFFQRHLKVGGVVFVSYNALPGWAPLMPVKHLLFGRLLGDGTVGQRLEQGLWIANRLNAHNAGYFQANPKAGSHLDGLASHKMNYLVHEYLNEQWQPLYHADVARLLEPAKLEFATNARVAEQLDGLTIPDDARDLMERAAGSIERETLRDYFTNTRFRRDIFVRGAIGTVEAEAMQLARRTRFALVRPRDEISSTAQLSGAELDLNPALYEPLLEILAEGPSTLDTLSQHPALRATAFDTLFEALMILTTVQHVAPCPSEDGEAGRRAHVQGFNTEILRRSEFARGIGFLASPITGQGVEVSRLHQMMRLAEIRGLDRCDFASSALRAGGECFLQDGKPVGDEAVNRQIMAKRVVAFDTTQRPLMQSLGLI